MIGMRTNVSRISTKKFSICSQLNFFHQVTMKQAFTSLALVKWDFFLAEFDKHVQRNNFFIFLCVDMFHTSSACVDTLDWKLRQACRFGRFCQNSNSGTCIFFSKLIKLTFMFLKVVIFSWIFLRSLNAWKESRKNWTRAWKWKHCEQFRPWCFIKFLNLILFVIMNKNYCCQGGRTMTRVTRDKTNDCYRGYNLEVYLFVNNHRVSHKLGQFALMSSLNLSRFFWLACWTLL